MEKQKARVADGTHAKNILVPIDFSIASKKAFTHALNLAGKRSRVVLLHVISPNGHSHANLPALIAGAKRTLNDFGKSSGTNRNHPIRSLVRTGVAFQEILATAQENNVEMIVLGVHNSGPLDGVELGHTVDRVSRYARSPVLLVRESDAGKPSALRPAFHV